jgi:hypothetical protein
MRSRKKDTRDVNQIAASIIGKVINDTEATPTKNPAAVALGHLGGLKGGPARAKSLSAKRRKEIAHKAIAARWAKHKSK